MYDGSVRWLSCASARLLHQRVLSQPLSRSLEVGKFQALIPGFFLNPQVSGLQVSHATETDPSAERGRAPVVNETLDLCGLTGVEENGMSKLCFVDTHCAREVFW